MNKLIVVVAFVGLFWFSPLSAAQEKLTTPSIASLLTVTATQIGEQHCQNYPDDFAVFVRLRLRFRNESSGKVILARQVESPVRVRVSTSLEALKEGRFIYHPSVSEVTNQPRKLEKVGDAPDPARFITLEPKGEFVTETWSTVLANLSTSLRKTPDIGPTAGEYVMQLFVKTWPYTSVPDEEVRRVAKRWNSWGSLMTETLLSEPIAIELPKIKHSIACSEFRRPK